MSEANLREKLRLQGERMSDMERTVKEQRNRIRKLEKKRMQWRSRAELHIDPTAAHNEAAQHRRIQELREENRLLKLQLATLGVKA